MSYAGFYINLDRCPDRRAEMEAEFARCGVAQRYSRHPAAEGSILGLPNPRLNDGEIGCFTSHYSILRDHAGSDRHLFILEDDVIFASNTHAAIDRIIASGEIDAYDILYTDIAIPLANDAYREFKTLYDKIILRDERGALKGAAFQVLGLSPFMAPAASAYLVNRKSIAKIGGLMHEELKRGAHLPVDAFLFEKIREGSVRAGFVFPFLTSVRVEHTLTSAVRQAPDSTRRFTASNLARYSFFIGYDTEKGHELLRLLPQPPAGDRHAQLLAQILAFSLLDPTPRDNP